MKKNILTTSVPGRKFPARALKKAAKVLELKTSDEADFRDRLNWVKEILDSKTPTQQKTNPQVLRKFAEEVSGKVEEALRVLRTLEAEIKMESRFRTKEAILTSEIRESSKTDKRLSSGLMGWDWPRPFDKDLEQAIVGLEKIQPQFNKFTLKTRKSVPKRGTAKPGKDQSDRLIIQLCTIYRDYTGKRPMAWTTGNATFNAGEIYGTIIPFLQALLPHTNYPYRTTEIALQRKLERLRNYLK